MSHRTPASASVTQPPATVRILDAARDLVRRGGAADVTMGHVAASARVSKALVHYHYKDKDSLLQALVESVGHSILQRARAAVSADSGSHVLDTHWAWLLEELRCGDLNILAALGASNSPRVRSLSRRVRAQRIDIAEEQIEHIFQRLELRPRLPARLIAETVLAFTDGLAASIALDPARDPRPAFDVLWLALLSLVE